MAWLSGWDYRKSHVINSATGTGTGYQICVTVNYGSGSDSGSDVYLDSKCKADFGDIRFTDDDGETELDYWMQEMTASTDAIFWVKINDDLTSSNATIYVYYGNTGASTTSDGEDTFNFFDHFDGGSLDTSKWGYTESPSVSGTEVYLQATDAYEKIYAKTGYDDGLSTPKELRMKWRYANQEGNHGTGVLNFVSYANGDGTGNAHYGSWYEYSGGRVYVGLNSTSSYWASDDPETGENYISSLKILTNGVTYKVTGDQSLEFTKTGTPTITAAYVGLIAGWDAGSYVDWVFVRKLTATEPTHGSWGNEEEDGGGTGENGEFNNLTVNKELLLPCDDTPQLSNVQMIADVQPVNGGMYYITPNITISGGKGADATATATISGGSVNSLTLTAGGNNYITDPYVGISGGKGADATATATISGESVTSISVTDGGSNYVSTPTVTITGGGGSGATATATVSGGSVTSISVTAGGSGYTSSPTVAINGGKGADATATATISGESVTSISVTDGGSNYVSPPTVTISSGKGADATATATVSGGAITSIEVTNGGINYISTPIVTITGGGGSGATATATASGGMITSIAVNNGGSGFTLPTVTITGGGGSGATATATVSGGIITSISVTNGGTGYTSVPDVTVSTPEYGASADAKANIASGSVVSIEITSVLPTGSTLIKLKDTVSNYYTNLFLITSSDNYDAPLLATDQGFIIKKDIMAGGFLGSGQGAILLNHGLKGRPTLSSPPCIEMMSSGKTYPAGTTFPNNPETGQLFTRLAVPHIWTGSEWITGDFSGYYDTLFLFKADGITPAHMDLGTLTATKLKLKSTNNMFAVVAGDNGLNQDTYLIPQNPSQGGLGLGTAAHPFKWIDAETVFTNGINVLSGDLTLYPSIIFNGGIKSSFNPSTDNTYGLGSGSHRWQGIVALTGYFDDLKTTAGNTYVLDLDNMPNQGTDGYVLKAQGAGNPPVWEDPGSVSVPWDAVPESIIPSSNDTYDLGSETYAWSDIYSDEGHIGDLTANKVVNTSTELVLDSPIAIRTLRKLRINPETDDPVLELRKNDAERVFLGHDGTDSFLSSRTGKLVLESPIAIETLHKLRINPETDDPVLELRKNDAERIFLGHNGTDSYISSRLGDLNLGSTDTGKTIVTGDLEVTGDIIGQITQVGEKGSTSTNGSGEATITFNQSFGSTPLVFVQAIDATGRGIRIDVTTKSPTSFSVKATINAEHKHVVGRADETDPFTMSVADENSHTHYFSGLAAVNAPTSGTVSVASSGHTHNFSSYSGAPTATTQINTPMFQTCPSGHSNCQAYDVYEQFVGSSDHTHPYASTTGVPSGTTSVSSSGHAHSNGSCAGTTGIGSAHTHTLTNKPGYVRSIYMRDINGASYTIGGTLVESTKNGTDLYTEETELSAEGVVVSLDWMAIPQ